MSWRGVAAAIGAVVMLAASSVGWQHVAEPAERAERVDDTAGLDGAALFRAKGCASCHDGPDSTGSYGFPSLADARSWAGTRTEGLSADGYLAESIREPWVFSSPAFRSTGGPVDAMPVLGLNDEEINAIVRYLLAAR